MVIQAKSKTTRTRQKTRVSKKQVEPVEAVTPEVTPIEEKPVLFTVRPGMQWYVLQVYSGFEMSVMESIRKRILEFDKEELFGEMLVPKEKVVEMKKGQKCTSERKYFPSYVLIQMAMSDDAWHLIKSVPKVVRIVGSLSQKEIEDILNQMQAGADRPKPKIVYEVGEVVRIKDGPFTDFNGVVEEINYEKNRLKIAVLIFGRSTPVELEFEQVEKC